MLRRIQRETTFGAQMIKIPVHESRIIQNREGFDRKCSPPDVTAALQ